MGGIWATGNGKGGGSWSLRLDWIGVSDTEGWSVRTWGDRPRDLRHLRHVQGELMVEEGSCGVEKEGCGDVFDECGMESDSDRVLDAVEGRSLQVCSARRERQRRELE
jgi:hypothetical protein